MFRPLDKKTITYNESLQLQGLLILATKHRKTLEDIADVVRELTGDSSSSSSDAVFTDDFPVDLLLSHLKITVEK